MIDRIQEVLWCLCVASQAIVLIVLGRRRLLSKYRTLAALLMACLLQSAVLGSMALAGYGHRTFAYFYAWCVTQSLVYLAWIATTYAVIDCLVKLFHRMGWIRRRIFETVYFSACLCLVLAASQIGIRSHIPSVAWAWLSEYLAGACCVALVLVKVRLYSSFLDISYKPNFLLHVRTLAWYFLSAWAGYFAIHISAGRFLAYGSIWLQASLLTCYVLWLRMDRPGETAPQLKPLSPDEQRLADEFKRRRPSLAGTRVLQ